MDWLEYDLPTFLIRLIIQIREYNEHIQNQSRRPDLCDSLSPEGDPQAAISYAFSEWEEGHMTKITAFNPYSMEIEEEFQIPLSPRLIRAALDEGGIEPADVGSVRGIELYDGYEVDPADQSEYLPDDIAEEIDDSDSSFDTANDVRKSDSDQFGR